VLSVDTVVKPVSTTAYAEDILAGFIRQYLSLIDEVQAVRGVFVRVGRISWF